MTAMEQHRLEKRRMHRHSCVIAILCERIYSETAQIGKAENVQTLGCVIAILQKGFNVEQLRWDKQRTHRHSGVIASHCTIASLTRTLIEKNRYRILRRGENKSSFAQQQAQHKQGKEETRWLGTQQEYVSPLGKTQVQPEYAWQRSGTLLNTAGRGWTLLNNIKQG